jgi:hypothetical protein
MRGGVDLKNDDEVFNYWASTPNLPQNTDLKGEPTIGSCLKCSMRREDEIFMNPELGGLSFKKTILDQFTAGKTPRVVPENLLRFYLWKNSFSTEHAAHVDDVGGAGIVVMGGLMLNGGVTLFSYLVDGTHRAVSALRNGREFKAYVLGIDETTLCAKQTGAFLRSKSGQAILVDPLPKLGRAA